MKICCHCKLSKELSDFGRDKSTKDGLKRTCKECLRHSYKIYHAKNPEKATQRMRKWSQVPENKAKVAQRAKDRYWKSPEIYRERSRALKLTPLGKIRVAKYNSVRRNRERHQVNNLTLFDVNTLLELQHHRCARCLEKFSDKLKYTFDHILPLSMGGNLECSNVQLLCRSCNAIKNKKFVKFREPLPSEKLIGAGG